MKIHFHEVPFFCPCGLKGTVTQLSVRIDGTINIDGLCIVCGNEFSQEYDWCNLMVNATIRDYLKKREETPEDCLTDFVPQGRPNWNSDTLTTGRCSVLIAVAYASSGWETWWRTSASTATASFSKGKKMKKRRRWRNRHHLRPRSRRGGNNCQNLLYIDGRVHQMWHLVFKNRTLDEVIALLIRVKRAKEHQSDYRFDRRAWL